MLNAGTNTASEKTQYKYTTSRTSAFSSCTALKDITLGTVTSASSDMFSYITDLSQTNLSLGSGTEGVDANKWTPPTVGGGNTYTLNKITVRSE